MTKNSNNTDKLVHKQSARIDSDVDSLKQSFSDNLAYVQGKFPSVATKNDYYMALSYTIKDRLMDCWVKTSSTYFEKASRTICYLSAEFLLGPQLGNNINNLGIYDNVKQAMAEFNLSLDDIYEQEVEPGLGNGGLGRLAACYMDSLATLNVPAIGYGIRYEFGIFSQEIRNGWQVECTDKWLRYGNPWEIHRPEINFDVKFGGWTEHYIDENERFRVRWVSSDVVKGVAYDMPVLGYKSNSANFIRLWKAEACESFDFQAFNVGDYYRAVNEKMESENITKVLYPNDEPLVGRKLRLQQQYFFVSSSLQDMIRIYRQRREDLEGFCDKYAVQLNDTHPSIGIVELMRILLDDYQMSWEKSWDITTRTFCYTNHTVLSEAMEKWPIALFGSVLPRHLEIVFEMNWRFIQELREKHGYGEDKIKRLSLIDESGERYVRMANIACVGSYAINGVSQLHTELLQNDVLRDFYEMWPKKFSNKTNGITPRRFLLLDNPRLSELITDTIGDEWVKDLKLLRKLEDFADDKKFQKKWMDVKQENKNELASLIHRYFQLEVNPESLFDIQTKRIHEYKRQHLNILHVVTLYNRIRRNPEKDFTPRTVLFAGKAAPSYFMAKLIIKLVNSLAEVINNDPVVNGRLHVVFVPNFNVKEARWIYKAADVSEQISMAGKEASGTGNMKFALNGALTVGTLDGANVEMREEFGEENFFLFGLKHDEITALKSEGYNPIDYINADFELNEAIELIRSGYFSKAEPNLFHPLIDSILYRDEYVLCADYRSYVDMQSQISEIYKDKARWAKMSILNVARIGKFSSDRAIMEYAEDIWNIKT